MYSGRERFGEKGRLLYIFLIRSDDRKIPGRGGGWPNVLRTDKNDDIKGSVTRV